MYNTLAKTLFPTIKPQKNPYFSKGDKTLIWTTLGWSTGWMGWMAYQMYKMNKDL